MTAGLPNISYENGFINRLCRGVGHVSLFFLTLWACMARNGNCTIDVFWKRFVTCVLRLKWGFWRKQPLNNLGLSWRCMIYRHKILDVFWLGCTAIKGRWVEVDAARSSWLNGMDSHQRKLKLMQTGQDITTGWGKWVSLWGKPPLLESRWSSWWSWQLMSYEDELSAQ